MKSVTATFTILTHGRLERNSLMQIEFIFHPMDHCFVQRELQLSWKINHSYSLLKHLRFIYSIKVKLRTSDKALTTDRPTPCSPPATLQLLVEPPNLPPACINCIIKRKSLQDRRWKLLNIQTCQLLTTQKKILVLSYGQAPYKAI